MKAVRIRAEKTGLFIQCCRNSRSHLSGAVWKRVETRGEVSDPNGRVNDEYAYNSMFGAMFDVTHVR